ncbi:TetR/AcrR family transcriptional regulator [Nocardioides piscis]|uniref:TetR/AcrR family transcriptional regulator n=1 Tax=Nocardioides piscis TaxID=2714938 RepID=UPI001FE27903|nr:TetR family transcriptional regulator [Nocardioides piscis]
MDRRKARTRQALIAAAQGFLAEGRTTVSIQDLTDRADVGFGSFYNHFESKDELFEEAVTSTLQAYALLRDELVAGIEDPAEVFAASFRLTGRLQRRLPEQVRVLLHKGTQLLVHEEGLAPRARHDLKVAFDAGRFDLDDVELGLMAVGGALLGLMQMLESDPTLDDADVSDRFTERVLRALGMTAAEAAEICRRPLPELPDFE